MASNYLLILLVTPLIFATFQFVWGLENIKKNELIKANMSKFVYSLQFLASIYAYFQIPNQKISLQIVHLKHYHYDLMLDLQKPFFLYAIIFSLLFMLTEKLSFNYLHAEEEHSKFYSLKMMLNFSLLAFLFTENIDFLFFCWEIVGISSALLISYFYRRNQAVENSLFAFSIYRICDAAFLLSALLLYHFYEVETINYQATGIQATILGTLLFISIMGKTGVYPMSSWLPQALEGPTPSSNLYYMTMSTHLGPILMIKSYPLWQESILVKVLIVSFALITIVFTTLSSRSQVTIKGSLGYSTLAQVSLILIEVAFGLHTFALVHIGLHIFHRLAQMALSPSIIDQHNLMEKLSVKVERKEFKGNLYFYAVNCFGSERIIKSFLKLLINISFAIGKIEELLMFNSDIESNHSQESIVSGGAE